MAIGRQLRRLDDAAGAGSVAVFISWVAGYWCVVAGIGFTTAGLITLISGFAHWFGLLISGAFSLGIGLLIGPKHMIRHLLPRGSRWALRVGNR